MEKNYLDGFGNMALTSWKENRPKMVKELTKNGTLREAPINAQTMAAEEMGERVRQGEGGEQAREAVLRTWILLPPEKEVPILSVDLMPYHQPEGATATPRRHRTPKSKR